jgi:putative membrane protein
MSSTAAPLALAQTSTPESAAERATLQTPGGRWASIEAQVKNTLEASGYKKVTILPTSFVIQAEKDGHPILLVVNSESDTVTYLSVERLALGDQNNGDQAGASGEKEADAVLGVAPKTASFVEEAAEGDMFEIQASQLAASKTQGDVQAFANQMIKDHSKTSGELKARAQQAEIKIPSSLSGSQQAMLDKLGSLNGKDFTKQYLDDKVTAHRQALSLFERYGKGGEDNTLKAWALQLLPTLRHHLDMAQKLGGQAASDQGAASGTAIPCQTGKMGQAQMPSSAATSREQVGKMGEQEKTPATATASDANGC